MNMWRCCSQARAARAKAIWHKPSGIVLYKKA